MSELSSEFARKELKNIAMEYAKIAIVMQGLCDRVNTLAGRVEQIAEASRRASPKRRAAGVDITRQTKVDAYVFYRKHPHLSKQTVANIFGIGSGGRITELEQEMTSVRSRNSAP